RGGRLDQQDRLIFLARRQREFSRPGDLRLDIAGPSAVAAPVAYLQLNLALAPAMVLDRQRHHPALAHACIDNQVGVCDAAAAVTAVAAATITVAMLAAAVVMVRVLVRLRAHAGPGRV